MGETMVCCAHVWWRAIAEWARVLLVVVSPRLPIPTPRCIVAELLVVPLVKIRTPSPWAQLTRCAPNP
jgi:hypothetical protein